MFNTKELIFRLKDLGYGNGQIKEVLHVIHDIEDAELDAQGRTHCKKCGYFLGENHECLENSYRSFEALKASLE